jgi:outer membrane protein assembly factor BamB
VAVTSYGGNIAAGHTESVDGDFGPTSGGQDALIAGFGPDGDLSWSHTLGGADEDEFSSVAATADGGAVAARSTWSFDADGYGDAIIGRLSSEGELLWTRTLGATEGYSFSSVAVPADGGILAGGSSDLGPLVVRLTPDGGLGPE